MSGADLLGLARRVMSIEAEALLASRARLDATFLRVVELIQSQCPPGRVVVMGVGKSGHVAHKIAATLASTGTPAFFVHPTEAGHGDLGMITRQDVVLAISYSGRSDEILSLMPYLKRNGVPLIAITGDAASPLADHAEAWLDARVEQEACQLGIVPTASTTLALALGDALAVCLVERRGFTTEEFAVTHPHGSLGRRLLVTVRDIMLTGDEVPAVREATTIRESLVEMSRGGIGITAVVDAGRYIVGVFTDGDLRRALDNNIDIHHTPVSTVMTRQPKTIRPQQLAVEAAEIMERGKVTALPVADAEGRLIGALNMRILLRAGVL